MNTEPQPGLTVGVESPIVAHRPIEPKHFRELAAAADDLEVATVAADKARRKLWHVVRQVHREGGYSFAAIGVAVGLTRQRIEQIVRKP